MLVKDSMKLIIDLTFLFTFLITMNSGSLIESVCGLLSAFDPESGISPDLEFRSHHNSGLQNSQCCLD